MAELKKFLFDLDFEKKEIQKKISKENKPTLNPDEIPIFSRLEVNKFREEHERIGFDRGLEEGKIEALNDINQKLLDLVSNLTKKFAIIEDKYSERLKIINKDSINISLEIAKKLSSEFSKINPEKNVLSFIEEIFHQYRDVLLNEKIKIYVNDSILESINTYFNQNKLNLKENKNFELIGDKNLDINDSKIEWQFGGIEKKYNEMEKEIIRKINNFISNLDKNLNKNTEIEKNDDFENQGKSIEEENLSENKISTPLEQKEIKEEKKIDDQIKTVGGSKSIKYD